VRDALLADDGKLLAECEVDTYRASGPGGQKRNKTESAVRLRHKPSGLSVIAEESRSQSENRGRALRRLRKELALRLREPAGEGVPEAVRVCIDANGRLKVGQRDGRYIRAVAAVLDLLEASGGAVSDAADRLGVTTGNLSAFLTDDDDVMVEANRIRARHAMRPLRRD
jgi:RF-1 domain